MTKSDELNLNHNNILESILEGIILQNTEGTILFNNQSALEILGITQEDLQIHFGKDSIHSLNEWDNIFPGSRHKGMDSFLTGKIQKNNVLKIFRQDGEIRWLAINTIPLPQEDNKPKLILNTFRDITDSKKELNELLQIQYLYNISHDLMIITNFEGYFKKINPRFEKVLGYSLHEINSHKFLSFVHDEDLHSTKTEIDKLIANKGAIHFINRYRTKINEYRYFDWLAISDEELNFIYFTARDITSYRDEELKLIHSSKVYSIGELTSGIAYLINDQISIINAHTSFVLSRIDRSEINKNELKIKMLNIDSAASKLSKTIKELTSFVRNIENEQFSSFSLKYILDNVLNLLSERFRIHGVNLEIKIENDLYIYAKESQIAHILINILNISYNLVHEQRDSWVKIEGNASDQFVSITISTSITSKNLSYLKEFELVKDIIEQNLGLLKFDTTESGLIILIEFPKNINETKTQ